MLHINTLQIDTHCWKLEVTDGYQTIWNAKFSQFDNNLLVIRYGDKDYDKIHGEVDLIGKNESEIIGDAVALVYNWAQFLNQPNEPLNKRWRVSSNAYRRYHEKVLT